MNTDNAGRQVVHFLKGVTRGVTDGGQDNSGRLAACTGRHAVLSLAVEEIFLEGDTVVVLHHEAGSEQADGLLESAADLDTAPG